MGQEATCRVSWAGQSGQGKVLLEAQELILRGNDTLAAKLGIGGETEVRSTLRQAGLMDTRIASVSPTLTALRFHSRL
jgi:hypothetical protein